MHGILFLQSICFCWALHTEDFEKIAHACNVALAGSRGSEALHTAFFLLCSEVTHKELNVVRLDCPC